MTTLEKAEAAEHALSQELDRIVLKSVIYTSGERDPRQPLIRPDNGKLVMMGPDPRLPKMPDRPTLTDFFRLRFRQGRCAELPHQHLERGPVGAIRLEKRRLAGDRVLARRALHRHQRRHQRAACLRHRRWA